MMRAALAVALCLACVAHAAAADAPAPAPANPAIAGLSVTNEHLPSNCARKANVGDVATIHYTGKLENGTVFDSSVDRQPFSFQIGKHSVLPGIDAGVVGMCAGENRTLSMTPELGYGAKGAPPTVPPNAPLKFDIQMLNVTDPVAPAPNPLAPLAPLVTTFLQQGLQSILNGK